MDSNVISLDSSDEETPPIPPKKTTNMNFPAFPIISNFIPIKTVLNNDLVNSIVQRKTIPVNSIVQRKTIPVNSIVQRNTIPVNSIVQRKTIPFNKTQTSIPIRITKMKQTRCRNANIKRQSQHFPQHTKIMTPPTAKEVPFMPIIVSTQSLCKSSPVIAPPRLPSGITIKRTKIKLNDPPRNTINNNCLPQVTVRKKSEIINTKDFFNMVKPIPIINIDDDDDDNDKIINNKSVKVVEVEFENDVSANGSDNTLDFEMSKENNDHNDFTLEKDINSPLSSHDNSEKENSEPVEINNLDIIEEPIHKKPKLNHNGTDLNDIDEHKLGSLSKMKDRDIPKIYKKIEQDNITESENKIVAIAKNSQEAQNITKTNNKTDEINSVYQSFLDLCLKLDNSDDTQKIINKKLIIYYKRVDSRYTESDEFCNYIKDKIEEVKKFPEYLFIYIKEVADELKSHRPTQKPSKKLTTDCGAPSTEEPEVSTTSIDDVTQNRIAKLENYMKVLNRKIKKFDEAEVSFEDDNDSAYILADRCKARVLRIHEKLCKLKGERGIENAHKKKLHRILSQISLNEKELPNVVNEIKKIAGKKKCWFPDFHEILVAVKKSAVEAKYSLKEEDLRNKARSLFVEIGTALQQQRKSDEYQNLCEMLINCEKDPADHNPELVAVLNKNKLIRKKKEDEIINKYANYEFSSKIVAKEVKDENVDNSDDDSEEEVVILEKTDSNNGEKIESSTGEKIEKTVILPV